MGRHTARPAAPAPAPLPVAAGQGQAPHGMELAQHLSHLAMPTVVLPPATTPDHVVEFFVPSEAVGKGRARASLIPRKGGGWVVDRITKRPIITHYTPKETTDYEHKVAWYAKQAMAGRQPFTGPVLLVLRIGTVPTESWGVWKMKAVLAGLIKPTMKPDLDNIEKAVKDAMNKVVWDDDSQVVFAAKARAFRDVPGVHVTAMQLPYVASSVHTTAEYAAGHPIERGLINTREAAPF